MLERGTATVLDIDFSRFCQRRGTYAVSLGPDEARRMEWRLSYIRMEAIFLHWSNVTRLTQPKRTTESANFVLR